MVLASGDVLEIGDRGEAFRFRIYPPDSEAYKSVLEAFSDCVECLRRSDERPAARMASLASGMVGELRQISPMARILLSFVLLSFLGLVVSLAIQNQDLARRLGQEESRLAEIAALLQRLDQTSFRHQDVADLRERIGGELERTRARLEALEAQNLAPSRVIAETTGSVVFIQASYGFQDGAGRWLRRAVAPPGASTPPSGTPLTLEGSGPPAEIPYTGTGFVVSEEGHIFTNRHVAIPWDYDENAQLLIQRGFRGVITRMLGYIPSSHESFEISLLKAGDSVDVALLQCSGVAGSAMPLQLEPSLVSAGDEVIVMGYPAGIRALLARADPSFVDELAASPLDYWAIADRLSKACYITPLATLGIVGQVTPSSVVYDAETTHGGSGGPVLNLQGRVVAVNTAIIPGFGGSNIGVPAAEALKLLN